MADKYLIYPAAGDIDEDDGMTKLELLEMLAVELGYELVPPEAPCEHFDSHPAHAPAGTMFEPPAGGKT